VFVALVIQHVVGMRFVILSSVAFRQYQIFPHNLLNGMIVGKKKVAEHKMCVLILYRKFVWNIFHSKKTW